MKLAMTVVGAAFALVCCVFLGLDQLWVGIGFGLAGIAVSLCTLMEFRVTGDSIEYYPLRRAVERAMERRNPAAVVKEEEVVALDFSHKVKRREAEEAEWVQMFFEGLGKEAGDVLLSEWKTGSPRSVLAEQLRVDVEQAEKLGLPGTVMRLNGLRYEITANPEQKMGEVVLKVVRKERDRVVGGRW